MMNPSNCPCVTQDEIVPAYRRTSGETEFVTFEATLCVRCGTMIQSRTAVKEDAVDGDDPTEIEHGIEMVPKEQVSQI